MEIWLVWIIAGVILFIVELFTPVLFFLNLAIAAFFSAVAAYFGLAGIWQVLIFLIMGGVLIGFLRPLLIKGSKEGDTTVGLDDKYLGHIAKTILPTNAHDGRVTIYGEEWVARSSDGSEIEADADVKIIRNDGTVFYVEKI